ncbi:MAG: YncE family protein [Spirochaetales bacterium]
MWRYAAGTIMALSALILTGVLAYGVYDGSLAPGAAERRTAGPTSSDGSSGSAGAFGDAPDEHGVLTVSDDRRVLRSFEGDSFTSDESDGPQAEVELPGRASSIEPTPGGVSVWVSYEDRAEIDVFSTASLEHEASIEPPGADGRRPEHLAFSGNGQTLFVTWSDHDDISVYGHEMRELSERLTIEAEGTVGPVHPNRRATRLYRATEEGSIAVFFAQNGQRVGEIRPDEPAVGATLAFSDDHSLLWGVSEDRSVFAVDEAEASAHTGAVEVSADRAPAAAWSGESGITGDGRAVFVSEDATALEVVSVSDITSEASDSGGRVELSDMDGIEGGRVAHAAKSGTGTVLLVTDAGDTAEVDPAESVVRSTGSLSEGSADSINLVASYAIRRDGNFACF